jgi:arginine deiminase
MSSTAWEWANLKPEQLKELKEGERTLAVKPVRLLAYQPAQQPKVQQQKIAEAGLKVAALNASQLECLEGLEKKLSSVVVAYS